MITKGLKTNLCIGLDSAPNYHAERHGGNSRAIKVSSPAKSCQISRSFFELNYLRVFPSGGTMLNPDTVQQKGAVIPWWDDCVFSTHRTV